MSDQGQRYQRLCEQYLRWFSAIAFGWSSKESGLLFGDKGDAEDFVKDLLVELSRTEKSDGNRAYCRGALNNKLRIRYKERKDRDKYFGKPCGEAQRDNLLDGARYPIDTQILGPTQPEGYSHRLWEHAHPPVDIAQKMDVRAALDDLPHDQHRAVSLHAWGWSNKDAAALEGINPATFAKRLQRGLDAMREFLKDDYKEFFR